MSDHQRIDLIKRKLLMCSTFTTLSTLKYEAGDQNSAERSVGRAEELYAALLPLVSDPRLRKDLTNQQVQEANAELERVGDRLDGLQRFRKWPTELNNEPTAKRNTKSKS